MQVSGKLFSAISPALILNPQKFHKNVQFIWLAKDIKLAHVY